MRMYALRKWFFIGLFAVVGLIYIIQLFSMQVLDDKYKAFAESNYLKPVIQFPPRGLIYDRNGKLLVYNDAIYDLMVLPKQVKSFDTTEFVELLGLEREVFDKKWAKANEVPYKPSVFMKQVSGAAYAGFQERLFDFPGFYVEVRTDRKYKTKHATHVLGSIGEVNDNEIKRSESYYRQGEYIGKSGIEKSYEELLRGSKGIKKVVVDVMNRTVGSYAEGQFDTAAVTGTSIFTTLDLDLQRYGEQLMNGKLGSVVAIEPETGEVLALISSPAYDPNLLIGRERGNNYMKLLRDPMKPMFNRPLNAPYPPGSIFKAIEALIAQQEGVLRPGTMYHCGGGYRVGGHTVKCSHGHVSPLPLRPALMHSCNPYFCHVFRSIVDQRKFETFEASYTNYVNHLKTFGIGTKLGIDLYGEAKGILKEADYYNRLYGKGAWKGSTIISLAIGQGELGVTPLQMSNMMAIIANRGYYITPHVMKAYGEERKEVEFKKNYCSVDSQYFQVVVDGLADVVKSGTARIAQIDSIEVCGKTGTSQNPHGKDHSIFMAFAPKDNPKIAIAVVVENSGYGSQWAAPIASLMIEQYLFPERDLSAKRKWLEERMLTSNLIEEMLKDEQ